MSKLSDKPAFLIVPQFDERRGLFLGPVGHTDHDVFLMNIVGRERRCAQQKVKPVPSHRWGSK